MLHLFSTIKLSLLRFFTLLSKRATEREIVLAQKNKDYFKQIELFIREFIYVFRVHDVNSMSAQITYSFILSIVPFLAILFTFVHSFNGFDNIYNVTLKPLIFKNFGDEIAPQINTILEGFINNLQIKELGLIGFISFLVTLVFLLLKIEESFDKLIDVEERKAFINRLIKCWLLITLSPFLFAAASVKSELFLKSLKIFDVQVFDRETFFILHTLIGFMFQTLCFFVAYLVMPSRRMNLRALMTGALFASFLFEGLQIINIFFTKQAITGDPSKIYGTAPLVAILFFIWIRLIWVIVLGGAITSVAFERIITRSSSVRQYSFPAQNIAECLKIYTTISKKYRKEGVFSNFDFLCKNVRLNKFIVRKWIDFLVHKNLIVKTNIKGEISFFISLHALELEKNPGKFFEDIIFVNEEKMPENYEDLIGYFVKELD